MSKVKSTKFRFIAFLLCALLIVSLFSSVFPVLSSQVSALASLSDNDILIVFTGSLHWVDDANAKIYVSCDVNSSQWTEATQTCADDTNDNSHLCYSYTLPSGATKVRIARNPSAPTGSYDASTLSAWNYSAVISVVAGDIVRFKNSFGNNQNYDKLWHAALKPGDAIYYDTGNNQNEWSKSDSPYIYISNWFNADTGWFEPGGFQSTTLDEEYLSNKDSVNGSIYKCTVPSNVVILKQSSYETGNVITVTKYDNWAQAGAQDESGNHYYQSSDYYPENFTGKVAYYDCFANDTKKVKISFFEQSSLRETFDASGKTFYIVDMTGSLANQTVTCSYKDENDVSSSTSYTTSFDSTGKATITVPAKEASLGKWKSVTVVSSGINVLTNQILIDINYTTDNTLYYGITTNSSTGEAVRNEWGEPGRTGSAVSDKTLYMKRLDFSGKTVTVDGNDTTLTSNPVGTGNYSHYKSGITQPANHIFHVNDGVYTYNFFWTDSSKDLLVLDDSVASVSEVHNDSAIRNVYFDASMSKLSYEGTLGSNEFREMPQRNGGAIYASFYDSSKNNLATKTLTKLNAFTRTDANFGDRTYNDVYTAEAPSGAEYVMFYCGTEPSTIDAVMGKANTIRYVSTDLWDSVNLYIFDEDDSSKNTGESNTSITMTPLGNHAFEISKATIDATISSAGGNFVDPQIIFRKGGTTGTNTNDSSTDTYQDPRRGNGAYQVLYGAVFGGIKDTSVDGTATERYEIPDNLAEPCFYADTSDSTIFYGGRRGGYWQELGTIRDAEKEKVVDTVDIAKKRFTKADGARYINASFYDYYSDYEISGFNRDTYDVNAVGASQKNWVVFRQFDQALSDYYRDANVQIPIYSGHFQPTLNDSGGKPWGYQFKDVADTLNLYGWSSSGTDYNKFMSTNNSSIDYDNVTDDSMYAKVTQKLVNSSTSDGTSTGAVRTANNEADLPFFNKNFLLGDNSKNAKIGDVYDDVSFPFTYTADSSESGAKYWTFDSAETTLAFLQDPIDNNYYLEEKPRSKTVESGTDNTVANWSKNVDSASTEKSVYGFFPFNYGYTKSTAAKASTYNYCFGTSMNFSFMTTDGTVLKDESDPSSDSVPMKFKFSGDDDIWVFLDGQLILDMGGDHGKAVGEINFQDGTTTISTGVKKSVNNLSPSSTGTIPSTINYKDGKKHTMKIYYMERGMWESNMKIQFNATLTNTLTVEKEIDDSNVEEAFGAFTHYIKENHNFPVELSVRSNHSTDTKDYGSKSGYSLMYPVGSRYSKVSPDGSGGYTSSDVTFAGTGFLIKHDESVNFIKQFDTGAYMKMIENIPNEYAYLYDTEWTIREDNLPVDGKQNQSGTTVVDDRTESEATHSKPSDTFLYRSYSKAAQEYVDLTVQYTNIVKTGSVTINKAQYSDSSPLNDNTQYTFLVDCWNIGGLSGDAAVANHVYILTTGIVKNGSVQVTGIPINTKYTVYEVDANDGSAPKISGSYVAATNLGSKTYYPMGSDTSQTGTFSKVYKLVENQTVLAGGTTVTAENAFYVGSISAHKKWLLNGEESKKTASVTVKLQRSSDNGVNWDDVTADAYNNPVANGTLAENEWLCTFNNLPIQDTTRTVTYLYRIVECDVDGTTWITDTSTQRFNTDLIVVYSGNNVSLEKGVTKKVDIINSYGPPIIMPTTGGSGIIFIFPLGILAITLSGAAFVIYNRRMNSGKKAPKGRYVRK